MDPINRVQRIENVIINLIRLLLLLGMGGSIFTEQWIALFTSAVTLFLTYFPKMFAKKYKINLPMEYIIIIVLFIYIPLFLGEVFDFYDRFWWWDVLLHITTALIFGCIGFIILYVLYVGNKILAHPVWISIFAFCFAVAMGGIWEIFEFGMDQLFGLNMQKSGLSDTMWDLMVDCLGAAAASASGYAYLTNHKLSLVGRLIVHFYEKNKALLD